jgi:hypothetical protein
MLHPKGTHDVVIAEWDALAAFIIDIAKTTKKTLKNKKSCMVGQPRLRKTTMLVVISPVTGTATARAKIAATCTPTSTPSARDPIIRAVQITAVQRFDDIVLGNGKWNKLRC